MPKETPEAPQLGETELTKLSKTLSLALRHNPDKLGIVLDSAGYTDVDTLLSKMQSRGYSIDRAILDIVVETNNKKRFAFDAGKTRIRASQGHSVQVDLGYEPKDPPGLLYHGTAQKNLESIMANGLSKVSRTHVHLSADMSVALDVGRRHGKPVVLGVDAARMHADGHLFFLSDNGVWLTDSVPAKYLTVQTLDNNSKTFKN